MFLRCAYAKRARSRSGNHDDDFSVDGICPIGHVVLLWVGTFADPSEVLGASLAV